jgi:ABC-type transporter Mla maintaining outer membrane lipid asymmetry ATPase subunit MlaF
MSELAKLIDSVRGSMAVMLVDHHMDLVTSVCDKMVVLDFGQVIAAGVPSVVRQDERVLEAYLGREAEDAPLPASAGGSRLRSSQPTTAPSELSTARRSRFARGR